MIARSPEWLVWQLADSAFPTGGFAHSLGLEAAWQHGEVTDAATLRTFARHTILQAGHGVLPLVTAAFRAPARLEALDARAEIFLVNAVANRASRVQGRALVATCGRIWPSPDMAELDARARTLCGHAAPLMGVTLRTVGVPLWVIQKLVLYLAARSVLSAAVRLGIVGSYEAQRLQFECGGDLDYVLGRCAQLDEGSLAQAAPMLDLFQAAHERLYSRLFQS